jgi:hypothetical protein
MPGGGGPSVDFGYDQISEFFIESLREFVNSVSLPAAIGLWLFLLAVNLLEGADELTGQGGINGCRFFRGSWWMRFFICAGVMLAYDPIVIKTLAKVQPQMLASFGADWHQAWEESSAMLERSQSAGAQNAALRVAELLPMSDGSDSIGGGIASAIWKGALAATDRIIAALAPILCYFVGGLIMLYVLMQGFYLAAVTTLLCALGPVCIACGLHPKTEALALNWFKGLVLYMVFFGLMLVLAVRMGGGAMAAMDRVVIGAGIEFGDGSDVMVHLLQVVVGPMMVLMTLKAAPAVATYVLQAHVGSGEGGYGAFVGMVQQASQGLSRNMIDTMRRAGQGSGGGGPAAARAAGAAAGGSGQNAGHSGGSSGRRDLAGMRGG